MSGSFQSRMGGIVSSRNSGSQFFPPIQRSLNPGVGVQRKVTNPKMKMRMGNHMLQPSAPATLRGASHNLHNTDSLIKDLARGTIKKGCSACGRG
jgi:hypothetical protein